MGRTRYRQSKLGLIGSLTRYVPDPTTIKQRRYPKMGPFTPTSPDARTTHDRPSLFG